MSSMMPGFTSDRSSIGAVGVAVAVAVVAAVVAVVVASDCCCLIDGGGFSRRADGGRGIKNFWSAGEFDLLLLT